MFIGPTDQINHLVTFNRTGSWKHRIRAYTRDIMEIKTQNFAVTVDSNTGLNAVVSGMDITCKTLQSIGYKFDRPIEHDGKRNRCKVIGIGMNLDAK